MLANTNPDISRVQGTGIKINDLEQIAFSRNYQTAHEIFRRLSEEEKSKVRSKYVLHAVVAGGIEKIGKLAATCAEEGVQKEKEFVDEVVLFFIRSCHATGAQPRELFESILMWSDQLATLTYFQEALRYLKEGIELGVSRHPDLHVRLLLAKASILETLGRWDEAQSLLISLAERPYLIPDSNLIPDVIFKLSKASLLAGDAEYYSKLLFRGLKYFYMNMEKRGLFVDKICKTFRHSYKVLLNRKVKLGDKFLFFIHWLYFRTRNMTPIRLTQLSRFLKFGLLGYIYFIHYQCRRGVADSGVPKGRRKNILITRAMGGIGDLLMMSPGFHAMNKKHPQQEIHLAIPKRYFSLFEGNPNLKLLDIENDVVDCGAYKEWFNFTDCPAARMESRTAPEVRRSRINIFAKALGVHLLRNGRPRYFVSPQEREFQLRFWREQGLEGKTVVGIQLWAGESYRDYPHMEEVVETVSRDKHVLIFDAEKINGFAGTKILKIEEMPLRQAFALASGCNAIIAPDSLFVHLAAALDIPCVALYGPIDGKVRTKHYPKCKFLDARAQLSCVPCWRNENMLCKLTNMRRSVCMNQIPVSQVLTALNEVLHNGKA